MLMTRQLKDEIPLSESSQIYDVWKDTNSTPMVCVRA